MLILIVGDLRAEEAVLLHIPCILSRIEVLLFVVKT